MSNKMDFGKKLKFLRERAGKSQAQVAEEITERFSGRFRSMTQTNLSALENRQNAPREAVLEILAQYYGVSITFFFETSDKNEQTGIERARSYLDSLKNRQVNTGTILPHTTDNSSADDKVIRSLDNLNLWQPEYEPDEYLED